MKENFNFGYDSVDDIINSDEFKDIRRKMLKGEKVSGCERCYEHEENGNNSYRQFWKTVFSLLLFAGTLLILVSPT